MRLTESAFNDVYITLEGHHEFSVTVRCRLSRNNYHSWLVGHDLSYFLISNSKLSSYPYDSPG